MYTRTRIAGLDLMFWAYDRVMSEKAKEAKVHFNACHVYICLSFGQTKISIRYEKKVTLRVASCLLKSQRERKNLNQESCLQQSQMNPRETEKFPNPSSSAKKVTTSSLRDAAEQASLARFNRNSHTGTVVAAFLQERAISTQFPAPADKEVTEKKAITVYCDSCKKARILSLQEAGDAEHFKDPGTCVSLAKAGRNDGCDNIDDEVAQITGAPISKWLQKVSINTRQELAGASVVSTICGLVNPLDPSAQKLQEKLEKLEKLID
ncbi:hypothetical protein PsorP6_010319 [Peronosclerospora sorghi]|uniref:Uncharacterized protein n=1 Tax=Peronosclerospora sorghi TaxID=230839 RepID=A0ACC0VVM3_9STRA|nr:hypothetical protein PsorP6_010319 [Peronosclerospora sorghi]